MNLDIASAFKAIRRLRGLSQSEMADVIGISMRFYQDIERGDKLPAVDSLRVILERLKMTDIEFFSVAHITDNTLTKDTPIRRYSRWYVKNRN